MPKPNIAEMNLLRNCISLLDTLNSSLYYINQKFNSLYIFPFTPFCERKECKKLFEAFDGLLL